MKTLTYYMDTGAQIQIEFDDSIGHLEISREMGKSLYYHNISIDGKDTRRIEVGGFGLTNNPKEYATRRAIASIDLSPLSACADLHRLDLIDLDIYRIDLSPLNSCDKFESLCLTRNSMQSVDLSTINARDTIKELNLDWNNLFKIDLSPLSSWSNLERLDLSVNRITNIDLSPLSTCTNLEQVNLLSNKISTIDLSPLSTCTRLQKIELGNNKLRSVQLEPLSSCVNLKTLGLSNNEIRSIELSPLAACTKLRVLDLYNNWVQRINLNPLRFGDTFSWLNLGENQIKELDVTPLFGRPHARIVSTLKGLGGSEGRKMSWLQPRSVRGIRDTIYLPPLEPVPWSFLHEVAKQFKNNYRVQHEICLALGLIDYGFVDFDLTEILLSISPETTNEDCKKILIGSIVEVISETVKNGGSTTGLNLQKLLLEHKELAAHANSIIDLRKREVSRIRIPVNNINEVDLRGLWTTAYGFEILTALNMRLTTNQEGLDQIKSAFSNIGVSLKTCKISDTSAMMSRKLKETIWWIVENKGRLWVEILPPTIVDKKSKSSSLETELTEFLEGLHGIWIDVKFIYQELGYEDLREKSKVSAALLQLLREKKVELYWDKNGEYYKIEKTDDMEEEQDEVGKTIEDFMQTQIDEATKKAKDFKQTNLEDFFDEDE